MASKALPKCQKEDRLSAVLFFGGDGEIRTLDTLLGYTRFPIVRARPATRHLHIVARLSSAYAVFLLDSESYYNRFSL